jgi:hypothetical protein
LNVLKPNKKTTIQTLLARGAGQREIARITGIDRKTIRKYQAALAGANSSGVATGSAPLKEGEKADQNPPPRPPAHTSACEPWREFIQAQLLLKRNAMAICQDLVDVHGFGHGYNSVKRFVAQLRSREPEQFDRLEFAPGEEAQVDYGEGAMTLDPASGRWKRPRLFVMTLRYSRRSFRRGGVEVRPAGVGRAARAGVSLLRRGGALRRAGQPQGGRAQARSVGAGAQPGVRLVAGPLRLRGRLGAGTRPQPQGQRGKRDPAHSGHGAEGQAVRLTAGAKRIPRALGEHVGGQAHSRTPASSCRRSSSSARAPTPC